MQEVGESTVDTTGRAVGCVVKVRPVDRRFAGSIPDSTNFLTNSSGQATNALVSLFTKQ